MVDIDVVSNFYRRRGTQIWERLSTLRDIKNDIFFASVTPKALEAYR